MTDSRQSRRRFVSTGSLAVIVASQARGGPAVTATPDAFVTWARRQARPISDGALIRAAGDARVIAFAESVHGAHEPLALRNRMIALYAERGMIDAVALETGFIEARRLNDYVMGGPGDAVAVARNYFSWGFGELGENVGLLRWIRRFNSDRPGKKLRLIGVDIPGGKGAVLGSLSLGIHDGLAYLTATRLPEAGAVAASLTPYAEDFDPAAYFKLSPEGRAAFVRAVDDLVAVFDRHWPGLIAASSPDAFAWAQRGAVVLRQGAEMFRVWPEDNQGGTSAKGMYGTVVVRDKAMADNLLWFLDQDGPTTRVLAFAATGHLIKSANLAPPIPGFPGWWDQMGRHLNTALGRAMTVIVTAAGDGLPGGPFAGKPEAGSVAATLGMVGDKPFVLDIRDAPNCPWLDRPETLGRTIMMSMLAKPRDAFDVVIYYPTLTPAEKTSA